MIVTTTRMKVNSANQSELFQTILPLLGKVRGERGCVSSHLYMDVGDESSSLLVEEWETQADWNNHLQTRECSVLMVAVSVLCYPQSVEFQLLECVAGIEAITESRSPRE